MRRLIIFDGTIESFLNFRKPFAAHLINQGYAVHVIVWRSQNEFASDGLENEINFYLLPARRRLRSVAGLSVALLRMLIVILRVRPQGLIAFGVPQIFIGGLVTRIIPALFFLPVFTGLGYLFMRDDETRTKRWKPIHLVSPKILRFPLAKVKRVVTHNADDLVTLRNSRIIGEDVLGVVVNGSGVDLSQFTFSGPSLRLMTFIMIARLVKDKGVIEFIEASRLLFTENQGCRFVLVGAHDNVNPSQIDDELIEQFKRDGPVEFLDYVGDIKSLLAEATCFVLPSYREGLPKSGLEALASGLPIITTDVPGCRELVSEGSAITNGFLVSPRSVGDLYAKMSTFTKLAPEEISLMGEASRAFAENKFEVMKINENLAQVLTEGALNDQIT